MTDQLVFIDSHDSWRRMDSPTRELGIRGVVRARQALHDARARVIGGDEPPESGTGEFDTLAPAA